MDGEDGFFTVSTETVSLWEIPRLDGIVVVATKAYANHAIADAVTGRHVAGPIVILQNGIGVETPFVEAGFPQVCRGVLYMSSQFGPDGRLIFRQIASSPIGTIQGPESAVTECVAALTTSQFTFHTETNIQRAIWKKTIINSVFNSICPLLDIDNGIFARDRNVTHLATEIVGECVKLANCHGISLGVSEIMDQVLKISAGSEGVLISTLQDIRHGRETEMDSLNLALARIASSSMPRCGLPRTEFLGNLVLAKSRLVRSQR
jgi:2-dehydropantoate 2-reductase